MLQVILGFIWCISDFQKPCASKKAGLRVKDTSRSLCYPVLCSQCLPSCQAERPDPGLLVSVIFLLLQTSVYTDCSSLIAFLFAAILAILRAFRTSAPIYDPYFIELSCFRIRLCLGLVPLA